MLKFGLNSIRSYQAGQKIKQLEERQNPVQAAPAEQIPASPSPGAAHQFADIKPPSDDLRQRGMAYGGITALMAGQAALVRRAMPTGIPGGPAGFQPSLLGMARNPAAVRAAPMPIKVAGAALLASAMLAKRATGFTNKAKEEYL